MYPNYGNPQVLRVQGENGAKSLPIPLNSSCLALDENDPIVWLIQVDHMGCKNVTPYSIAPYEPEPQPDLKDIMDRLARVEERLNGESNTKSAKQQPRQ